MALKKISVGLKNMMDICIGLMFGKCIGSCSDYRKRKFIYKFPYLKKLCKMSYKGKGKYMFLDLKELNPT